MRPQSGPGCPMGHLSWFWCNGPRHRERKSSSKYRIPLWRPVGGFKQPRFKETGGQRPCDRSLCLEAAEARSSDTSFAIATAGARNEGGPWSALGTARGTRHRTAAAPARPSPPLHWRSGLGHRLTVGGSADERRFPSPDVARLALAGVSARAPWPGRSGRRGSLVPTRRNGSLRPRIRPPTVRPARPRRQRHRPGQGASHANTPLPAGRRP